MRILMIAPEPILEPRGTPFSVYHRTRALARLGHTIDLATYPIGQPINLPHVRVVRAPGLPWIRQIKIGPSLAKIPLDILLFFRVVLLLVVNRYDCIHTHEEAGVYGAFFAWLLRIPHVYDMHSDLSQQLTNFKFTKSRLLISLTRSVEHWIIRSASVVIVICPELRDTVLACDPRKPTILIENVAVAAEEAEQLHRQANLDASLARLRHEVDIPPGAGPILLYTGTFESYQGLEIVVESMPAVLAQCPTACFVFVGGRADQREALQRLAQRLGVAHALRLPGQRPPEEMPLFMQMADVLLSPRSQGTNTPLKIYSYLHSGVPILATNIRSHTQVLNPSVAYLVDPEPASMAQGAIALLMDAQLRQRLTQQARALANSQYSYDAYLARTTAAYQILAPRVRAA